MENLKIYDLCIVGSGLIGSSAARHATVGQLSPNVCVIGPDEPQDRQSADIFGAWYDEGRISRSTASDTLWAQLASRSIFRYRDIEKRSGIKFYEEVGCLTIAPEDEEFLKNTHKSAKDQGMSVSKLNTKETADLFPYMQIFDGAGSVFETQEAGYINPRLMREAQLTAAHLQGCDIIKDIVKDVEEKYHDGQLLMQVKTDGGLVVLSRKVLLAVGCFSEFRNLLPKGVTPHIIGKGQTVIFGELGPADMKKLNKMPSIIYKHPKLDFEGAVSEADKYNCYILPPIQYPDSDEKVYVKLGHSTSNAIIEPSLRHTEEMERWYKSKTSDFIHNHLVDTFQRAFNDKTYLKLGHGAQYEGIFHKPGEIKAWFVNDVDQSIVDGIKRMVDKVFPGITPVSYSTDTCVTAHTPTRRPYIELITPTLGVALGGNGYAAKSCDEIGKIAAEYVISGKWTYDWPQETFKFVHKPAESKL